MKTQIRSVLIAVLFLCLAAVPNIQAVVPAPDGGYPGFNTAEGINALKTLTTGVGNAAVGWYSLFSNTDGSFNTALGAGTLLFNVGDQSTLQGEYNTAIGAAALLFNTTGSYNTAIGVAALSKNTGFGANTATGYEALLNNENDEFNNAFGVNALHNNISGGANNAFGDQALSQSTGSDNTAIGS